MTPPLTDPRSPKRGHLPLPPGTRFCQKCPKRPNTPAHPRGLIREQTTRWTHRQAGSWATCLIRQQCEAINAGPRVETSTPTDFNKHLCVDQNIVIAIITDEADHYSPRLFIDPLIRLWMKIPTIPAAYYDMLGAGTECHTTPVTVSVTALRTSDSLRAIQSQWSSSCWLYHSRAPHPSICTNTAEMCHST